ncbi:MAG: hypothetical protein AAGC95_12205 [Pseudomonadota bacterium]
MTVQAEHAEIAALLQEGDRKEVARAGDVAAHVLAHPEAAGALLDCLKDGDATVKSHAAHALMQVAKADPDVLQAHVDRIFKEMGPDTQWEVREQFSKIVARLQLTKEQGKEAARLFSLYMKDKSSIVRTCALQGVYDLAEAGLYPRDKAKDFISHPLAHGGSKAMAARARKLLAEFT